MTCIAELDWYKGVHSPQNLNRAPFTTNLLFTKGTYWTGQHVVQFSAVTEKDFQVFDPDFSVVHSEGKQMEEEHIPATWRPSPFPSRCHSLPFGMALLVPHTKHIWNTSHTAPCPANLGFDFVIISYLSAKARESQAAWQLLLLCCSRRTNRVLRKSIGWRCYSLPYSLSK